MADIYDAIGWMANMYPDEVGNAERAKASAQFLNGGNPVRVNPKAHNDAVTGQRFNPVRMTGRKKRIVTPTDVITVPEVEPVPVETDMPTVNLPDLDVSAPSFDMPVVDNGYGALNEALPEAPASIGQFADTASNALQTMNPVGQKGLMQNLYGIGKQITPQEIVDAMSDFTTASQNLWQGPTAMEKIANPNPVVRDEYGGLHDVSTPKGPLPTPAWAQKWADADRGYIDAMGKDLMTPVRQQPATVPVSTPDDPADIPEKYVIRQILGNTAMPFVGGYRWLSENTPLGALYGDAPAQIGRAISGWTDHPADFETDWGREVGQHAASIGSSAAQMALAAMMPGNPELNIGLLSGLANYQDSREKGLDPLTATGAGIINGGIESLGEYAGGGLFQGMNATKAATKELMDSLGRGAWGDVIHGIYGGAKGMAKEVGTEVPTSVGQEYFDKVLDPSRPKADYGSVIGDTAIDTVGLSAFGAPAGIANTVNNISEHRAQARRDNAIRNEQDRLNALGFPTSPSEVVDIYNAKARPNIAPMEQAARENPTANASQNGRRALDIARQRQREDATVRKVNERANANVLNTGNMSVSNNVINPELTDKNGNNLLLDYINAAKNFRVHTAPTGGGEGPELKADENSTAPEMPNGVVKIDGKAMNVPGRKGVTVDHINERIKDNPALQRTNVVQSIKDLPADVQADIHEELKAQGKEGRTDLVEGYRSKRTGEAFLIGDNLKPERVEEVARHETIGHYGLQGMMDETEKGSYDKLMNDISSSIESNKVLQQLRDEVMKSQPGITGFQLAEEIAAKMAERNMHNTFTQRIFGAIRRFLHKAGLIKGNVTDAQLSKYLRDSQKWLANGNGIRGAEWSGMMSNKAAAEGAGNFSMTENTDKKYMDAVRSGDNATASQMVREQASAKGYAESEHKGWHESPRAGIAKEKFTNIDALRKELDDGGHLNLYAIANGVSNVPSDFFDYSGYRYYANDSRAAAESVRAIRPAMDSIRDQMEQYGEVKDMPEVTVYRAVPKDVVEGKLRSEGDWVSPSRAYVKEHGESRFGKGEYRIIKESVPAENLWFDGNDINEWGFDDGNKYLYKNTKNNRKSLDTVTYDSKGNPIPLSKRFDETKRSSNFSISDDEVRSRAEKSITKEMNDGFTNLSHILGVSKNDVLKKADAEIVKEGHHQKNYRPTAYQAIINKHIKDAWMSYGIVDKIKQDDFKRTNLDSPDTSVDANIQSGREAIREAIRTKSDINHAMYRSDAGWIDFKWGKEGNLRPNGKTKDGFGISHIIFERFRDGNLNENNALKVLDTIVDAIATGKIDPKRRREYDGAKNLPIVKGEAEAILVKDRKDPNVWVLSGWDKPVASRAGQDTVLATHTAADSSDGIVGAGVDSNITQTKQDDNTSNKENGNFSLIGEEGAKNIDKANNATAMLDSLEVARQMETSGRKAKDIKLATGWERTASGKWSYEIPDIQLKDVKFTNDEIKNGKTVKLGDIADAPELFQAYPYLKDMDVKLYTDDKSTTGGQFSKDGIALNTFGKTTTEFQKYLTRKNEIRKTPEYKEYEKETNKLLDLIFSDNAEDAAKAEKMMNEFDSDFYKTDIGKEYRRIEDYIAENLYTEQKIVLDRYARGTLIHEIQHAIQHKEGWAMGGSPEFADVFRDIIYKKSGEWSKERTAFVSAADYIARIEYIKNRRKYANNPDSFVKSSAWLQYGPVFGLPKDKASRAEIIQKAIDQWKADVEKSFGGVRGINHLEKDLGSEEAENKRLKAERKIMKDSLEGFSKSNKYFKLFESLSEMSDFEVYRHLAGETQARNAERRMNMTPEERRNSLAESTEDVARKDQILITQGMEAMDSVNQSRNENDSAKDKKTESGKQAGKADKAGNFSLSEHRGFVASENATQEELDEADRQYDEVRKKYENTPLWLKAPNGKDTKLNEQQWVQVRTENFKKWAGDWEKAGIKERLQNQKPIPVDVVHTGDVSGIKKNEAAKLLPESVTVRKVIGDVLVSRNGVRESIHHGRTNEKLDVIPKLKEIAEQAEYLGAMDDLNGAKIKNHYFAARVTHNNVEKVVFLRVREKGNSKNFYVHDVFVEDDIKQKVSSLQTSPQSWNNFAAIRGTDLYGAILQDIYSSGNATKVLDENGEPKVVYHGTVNGGHSVFDATKAEAEPAVWFAADRETAEDYSKTDFDEDTFDEVEPPQQTANSQIYPVFLNIRNPAVIDAKGKRHTNLSGIHKAVNDTENNDGVIINNVVDPKFNSSELEPTTTYAVRNSNQIKSATGNAGTFSQKNDNINFSLAEDESQDNSKNVGFDVPDITVADNIIRSLQDQDVDIKRVEDAILKAGGAINDESDVYLNKTLYISKVADRLERMNKEFTDPILTLINESGVSYDEASDFLYARMVYLDDVNQKLADINPGATVADGLSGMKQDEAEKLYKKHAGNQKLQKMADLVDKLMKRNVSTLVNSGLLTPEEATEWSDKWPHYVPRKRDNLGIRSETPWERAKKWIKAKGNPFKVKAERNGPTGGAPKAGGFETKGRESKRSLGSKRRATNILGNVFASATAGIMRSQKQEVAHALLKLAKDNPNPDFWVVDEPSKTKWLNPETGLVEYKFHHDKYDLSDSDRIFVVKVDGKERWIAFNRNNARAMEMCKALKASDAPKMMWFTQAIGQLTRWTGGWLTTHNPVFALFNFMRDQQHMMFNLEDTPLKGKQLQVFKNLPGAMKGVWEVTRGDRVNSKWAKYFDEFKRNGGETGFINNFANINDRVTDLKKRQKELARGKLNPRKWWSSFMDLIDDYNGITENGTRLAVYITARENGISEKQAARIAKEITVDFNRKGQRSSTLNAFYMFTNANIQGHARMFRAIKNSPRARWIAMSMVALGAGLSYVARAMMGKDPDTDKDKYDEISDFEKTTNWIFPTDTEGNYVKIPIAQGLHLLPSIGRIAVDTILNLANDKSSDTKHKVMHVIGQLMSLASVTADAFNPFGSAGSLPQLATPSVLRPAMQAYENKTFTGGLLHKNDAAYNGYNAPAYEKAFKRTPEHWVTLSKLLNDFTGGDSVKPGKLNVAPETLRLLFSSVFMPGMSTNIDRALGTFEKGKEWKTEDVPILNRLHGTAPNERMKEQKTYELMDNWKQSIEQMKRYRKQAEQLYQKNPDDPRIKELKQKYIETRTELGEGNDNRGRARFKLFNMFSKDMVEINSRIKEAKREHNDAEIERLENIRSNRLQRFQHKENDLFEKAEAGS